MEWKRDEHMKEKTKKAHPQIHICTAAGNRRWPSQNNSLYTKYFCYGEYQKRKHKRKYVQLKLTRIVAHAHCGHHWKQTTQIAGWINECMNGWMNVPWQMCIAYHLTNLWRERPYQKWQEKLWCLRAFSVLQKIFFNCFYFDILLDN